MPLLCLKVFFFFKQKTAYEIGTGDWSSDVCSSDLPFLTFRNPSLGLTKTIQFAPSCATPFRMVFFKLNHSYIDLAKTRVESPK